MTDTLRGSRPARHKHEWGYVELVTEKVQRKVYHPSPVGGLCIHCQKLRRPPRARRTSR